jgi:hypothetical protein
MQWAAMDNFIDRYGYAKAQANDSTGPENRIEAIGYLWEAWAANYRLKGGPFEYPWDKWSIPSWYDVRRWIREH